ncbi:MAG: hypothetical protein ACTSUF_11475 [Candidatus Heimdallarchaeaceae archaeon]
MNVLFIYELEDEGGSMFVSNSLIELKKELLFLNEVLKQSSKTVLYTLNEIQKSILCYAGTLLQEASYSLNKLSEKLEMKLHRPYSTIKWNLLKLKKLGFFESNGRQGDTSSTIELTALGKYIISVINNGTPKTIN